MTSSAEAPRSIKDIQQDLKKARRSQAWHGIKSISEFGSILPIFGITILAAASSKSNAPLVPGAVAIGLVLSGGVENFQAYLQSRAEKLSYKEELRTAKSQATGN